MKGAASAVDEVDFMVPDGITHTDELEQQLLFANERQQTHTLAHRLRTRLPAELHDAVQVYHSHRSICQRAWMMYLFERGDIRILVCTEAIAMGCDFENITQVVQFMITDSLTTWIQRAGRGGRNRTNICRCILLVQPSVFQLKAPRGKKKTTDSTRKVPKQLGVLAELFGCEPAPALVDDAESSDSEGEHTESDEEDDEIIEIEVEEDVDALSHDAAKPQESAAAPQPLHAETTPAAQQSVADTSAIPQTTSTVGPPKQKKLVRKARVFGKKVPKDLREFVSTKDCRGKVIDVTYRNPHHDEPRSGCCDLCIARAAASSRDTDADPSATDERAAPLPLEEQPAARARREPGTGDRRQDALEKARQCVLEWRSAVWLRDWEWSLFDEETVLSTEYVHIASKQRTIRTIDDLRRALPKWPPRMAVRYEADLLRVVQDIATKELEARVAEQRKKDEARRIAYQEKEAARLAQREVAHAERTARRPSSTKKEREALERQAERDRRRAEGLPCNRYWSRSDNTVACAALDRRWKPASPESARWSGSWAVTVQSS
ncbi:hypothetical protein AURDEDRAFT_166508 [Auricularia subglabra TFB-10046 SS5]|nr:hypothetical protein AURDEDRAFT_166508 [Auricularia subglabra TFB-10046 SS5]